MTIEVTAKKVEEAIKQGLEQLKASLDEVSVEVLDSGGFLRKAKVRLTLEREEEEKKEPEPKPQPKSEQKAEPAEQPTEKPEKSEKPQKKQEEAAEQPKKAPEKKAAPKPKKKPEQPKKTEEDSAPEHEPEKEPQRSANSEEAKKAIEGAREFIDELLKKMGFEDAAVAVNDNGDVDITAPAGDDSLIIGRHGETLSAISFLAETLARAEKQHVNIVADCNGYRERRAASLTSMAKRRAGECAAKHRKIKLEPMERIDRRTIHNALSGDDRVTTVSEGKEPYRYIVILPKKKGQ